VVLVVVLIGLVAAVFVFTLWADAGLAVLDWGVSARAGRRASFGSSGLRSRGVSCVCRAGEGAGGAVSLCCALAVVCCTRWRWRVNLERHFSRSSSRRRWFGDAVGGAGATGDGADGELAVSRSWSWS
jgi:hypothetical protein